MAGAKLIVGLGNPGKEYRGTRHNLGAMAVEALAERWGLSFKRKVLFKSWVATKRYEGGTVYLLLPTTYMNLSGAAVGMALRGYGVMNQDLVVVVDDVALPFGTLRYRERGSSGGHNGLKDVVRVVSEDFARIKVGIGEQVGSLESYVLSPFASREREWLPDVLGAAIEVTEGWLEGGSVEAAKRVEVVNKRLALHREQKGG